MSVDQEWKNEFRQYKWRGGDIDSTLLGNAPTMLSPGEQQMLHWLAREMPIDEGNCILDAGAFLGGSTVPLASGSCLNSGLNNKNSLIYTYDIFTAPHDGFSLGFIDNSKKPGDSVLDLFCKNVEKYLASLIIIAGDFLYSPPPPRNIDILFIDIAKTWEINDHLITKYFPLLVPGRSIVIQQDFNDQSVPWVKLTMFHFQEYFEHLCDDDGCRVFLCSKPIPPEMLQPLRVQLSYADMKRLFMKAIRDEENELSRYYICVSFGWLIFEFEGLAPAISHLSSINQPWEWSGRYIEMVAESMRYFQDNDGLRRWNAALFEAN